MSKTGRRLGRGLESLVSNLRSATADAIPVRRESAEALVPEGGAPPGVTTLPIGQLVPNPFQPRHEIPQESIRQLAESIRLHGVLQPIAVRQHAGGWQIIAGERRWQAAKACGLTSVPVVVREADDRQMLELALIENLLREDLNAIDRARAYEQFCTRFRLRAEDVAARVGEDRSTVANYLRLLELSEPIQEMLASGKLSMGHARCLLAVNDEALRHRLAQAVVQQDLSVRAVEEVVRREKDGATTAHRAVAHRLRSAHLKDMEQKFEKALKTKVSIREGRSKGTGRVVIEFFTLDDFDRIAGSLGVLLD